MLNNEILQGVSWIYGGGVSIFSGFFYVTDITFSVDFRRTMSKQKHVVNSSYITFMVLG